MAGGGIVFVYSRFIVKNDTRMVGRTSRSGWGFKDRNSRSMQSTPKLQATGHRLLLMLYAVYPDSSLVQHFKKSWPAWVKVDGNVDDRKPTARKTARRQDNGSAKESCGNN